MQNLIEIGLEKGELLTSFKKIVPYNIMQTNESYLESLLDTFYNDEQKADKLVAILIQWYLTTIHEKMLEDDHSLLEDQFHEIYEDEWLYLYYLYAGKYNEYDRWQRKRDHYISISQSEYEQLLTNKQSTQNTLLLKEDIHIKNSQIKRLEKQYKDIKESLKKYEKVIESHQELRLKYLLMDKTILLFIGNTNKEHVTQIKEKYGLKELKVFSSLESIPTQLGNHDYAVFSTQMATHASYFQVKSRLKGSILHTNKLNLNLIFEEISQEIEKELQR